MRERIKINQDWKFILGDNSSAHLTEFNDAFWEDVCLPHSVQITPTNCSGCRNYQGICRYRKKIFIQSSEKKERILLEFEAAMQVMELWINGKALPTHYCGFTTAVYDVTDYVLFDSENIISVRLDNSDNSEVPPGKLQANLDFTYEGGMYKSVYLHTVPSVHITNPILENIVAGGGIFVHYENVSSKFADVLIKTHVRNIGENGGFTLKQSILDENLQSVACCEEEIILAQEQAEHFESVVKVENPSLWSPYKPNLYTLKTEIIGENAEVIDEVLTTIGIRTAELRAEGAFINGEKIALTGGNYHMHFSQIGNAMPDNLLRRDARKLREAGMISMRSHYPFPDAFIDECDKLGITTIISNPGWQFFQEGIFEERALQNMREIVRKLRNHPSIVLWEAILNESKEMTDEFILKVSALVHEEFPYDFCYTADDKGLGDVAYKWWDKRMYGKFLIKHPEHFDEVVKNGKGKPRWIREYGDGPVVAWKAPRFAGEAAMVKQVNDLIGTENEIWHSNYNSAYNDKTLTGYGVWPAIEHNRGVAPTPSYSGFLDLQRLPKYSFYFYKSQRSPLDIIENVESGAMVFIANAWAPLSPKDVTVYSNCEKVRLYYNDEFVEERTADDVAVGKPPFTFKGDFHCARERTGIRVEGIIGGEVVAQDARFCPGFTTEIKLEADYNGIDLVADGSDILFVKCSALDEFGDVVPYTFDDNEIVFSIEGEGKIIGDTVKKTEVGVTGFLVQSTKKAGEIKVFAKLKYPQKTNFKFINGELEIHSKMH